MGYSKKHKGPESQQLIINYVEVPSVYIKKTNHQKVQLQFHIYANLLNGVYGHMKNLVGHQNGTISLFVILNRI